MRKTLPTLILDSAFIFILLHAQVGGGQQSSSWIATYNSFTDVEEELFFFFCMLRLAGPQSTIWTTTFNSFTDVEEELFFFFYMLWIEGGASIYKWNKYSSSSSTFSEWKGSVMRKTLPTLILDSEYTEAEKKILLLLCSQSGRGVSLC